MAEGKLPGNDGITVNLYKVLWKYIKHPLFESFKEGSEKGELSTSQRQTLIRLILKKGKDLNKLSNWRPIRLINVHAKIYSRALAERLVEYLQEVIGPDQLGFVKGQVITDGNRLLDNIIYSYEKENQEGILPFIDFRKACDTISHDYVFKMLAVAGLWQAHTILVNVTLTSVLLHQMCVPAVKHAPLDLPPHDCSRVVS